MELDALDVVGPVPEPHDLTLLGPGRDLQDRRERLALDDERVVTAGRERVGEPGEDPLAVVVYRARLAVDDPHVADHLGAEGLADRLVAEADPQDRQLAGELADGGERHARLVRRARARREDEPVRQEGPDAGDVDLVVPEDRDVRPQLAEVLHHVERERVVVVDQQDAPDLGSRARLDVGGAHRRLLICVAGSGATASSERASAWATAVKTARALLTVSTYSAAGSES